MGLRTVADDINGPRFGQPASARSSREFRWRHPRSQRSNPSRGKREGWIASSLALLAMMAHTSSFSRRAFARGLQEILAL